MKYLHVENCIEVFSSAQYMYGRAGNTDTPHGIRRVQWAGGFIRLQDR